MYLFAHAGILSREYSPMAVVNASPTRIQSIRTPSWAAIFASSNSSISPRSAGDMSKMLRGYSNRILNIHFFIASAIYSSFLAFTVLLYHNSLSLLRTTHVSADILLFSALRRQRVHGFEEVSIHDILHSRTCRTPDNPSSASRRLALRRQNLTRHKDDFLSPVRIIYVCFQRILVRKPREKVESGQALHLIDCRDEG